MLRILSSMNRALAIDSAYPEGGLVKFALMALISVFIAGIAVLP